MSLEFYLFDVNHGQSAAVKLPNGAWCLFDAGACAELSPTDFIRRIEGYPFRPSLTTAIQRPPFSYLKTTISHLHGDHVADWEKVFGTGPSFLRTVDYDRDYVEDALATSSDESKQTILDFCTKGASGFSPTAAVPNYGGASIYELSLPVTVARALGGTQNSRVNNASVVTRISCHGHSILICGDMEAEAWDFVLNRWVDYAAWRQLVSRVDVLVAPHHGHSSAYSVDLMALANPGVVLVSARSGDDSVESRYSQIQGIVIGSDPYKMISTRQKGSIKITVNPGQTLLGPPAVFWNFDVDGRRAESERQLKALFSGQFWRPLAGNT